MKLLIEYLNFLAELLFNYNFTESACARSCFFILCPIAFFAGFEENRTRRKKGKKEKRKKENSSSSLSEDCRTRRVQSTAERGLSNSPSSFSEDGRTTHRVHIMLPFPIGALRVQRLQVNFLMNCLMKISFWGGASFQKMAAEIYNFSAKRS